MCTHVCFIPKGGRAFWIEVAVWWAASNIRDYAECWSLILGGMFVESHCRCVSVWSIDECEQAEGKCQITIFMNLLLIMTALSILVAEKIISTRIPFHSRHYLEAPFSCMHTHMKWQQCFLGDAHWEVRELRASVCSPACCFLRLHHQHLLLLFITPSTIYCLCFFLSFILLKQKIYQI